MPQRYPHQFGDEPQPQAEKNQPNGQPRRLFTIDAYEALFLGGVAWLGLRSMIDAVNGPIGAVKRP